MFSNDIDYADRIIILIRTGVKFLRGTIRRFSSNKPKDYSLLGNMFRFHMQHTHERKMICFEITV